MTFGPYGVGRLDGKTVMVSHSVPGDLLDVTLISEHRDYALARLERVVRPGDGRRVTPCPFLPRCGGCDWQQMSYAAQLPLKAEVIAGELQRALGIQLDPRGLVEPAPAEFGYRSRIRLKTDGRGRLGFHELGTHRLVEIDHCMVAAASLRLPRRLAEALGHSCTEIEVVKREEREVLVAHMRKPPGLREIERAREVLRCDELIAGIVLRGGKVRQVIGNAVISIEPEQGLALEVDADLFSQVNQAQNQKLVATVMEMARPATGVEILDLFCGAGNFSLPAARRGARVMGVDAEPLATAAAACNAARLELKGTRFVAMKAAETAQFLLRAGYRPQAVIIDPPRTGAADLMAPIVRLAPRHIVYVSCDPSTLARDLRMLGSAYRLERMRALDFFPNTHHAEVAVHMVLT